MSPRLSAAVGLASSLAHRSLAVQGQEKGDHAIERSYVALGRQAEVRSASVS
jgi:hypothetical protein